MILCIVQARMGSTRLPGKVLKNVYGKAMLQHEVERLMRSGFIDRLVVATTIGEHDDKIADLCKKSNILYYRGSEEDVLDRYYQAAVHFGADKGDGIVRITGDCPLIDSSIVDKVIEEFIKAGVDYATNTNPPTYPDGLDVEVFTFEALESAWQEAKLISEREHVTPFIRNHSELFTSVNISREGSDLSLLRWTLDEEEDFILIKYVFEKLYGMKKDFVTGDILKLMEDNPEEFKKNMKFYRNEGYIKSIENEKRL